MTESFVDLGYRGVSLARRIKLAQVRPSAAYLETPAPMPVGSAITITGDDGTTIEAVVTMIHEQVGGSTTTPGMAVKPTLAGAAAEWWQARVTLPEEEPAKPRVIVDPVETPAPGVAQPRATAPMAAVTPESTLPAAVPPMPSASEQAQIVSRNRSDSAAPVPIIEPDDHSKRTSIMDAVSAEQLAALTAVDDDDGKKTEMMASVDLAALGLDNPASSSGGIPVSSDASDESEPADRPSATDVKSGPGGTVKRRKKKR